MRRFNIFSAVFFMLLRNTVKGFSALSCQKVRQQRQHPSFRNIEGVRTTLSSLNFQRRKRISSSLFSLTLFSSQCSFRQNGHYGIVTRLFSTSDVTQDASFILEGLNPSQVEAVTKPPHAITRVIAGPGSGKTRVLTCRVAYLLEQDPRSRVLAVTFTKKAAEEMRQRVESLLAQGMAQTTTERVTKDGIVNEDLAPTIPKDLGRVTMGTFHSICAKILRYNGDLLVNLLSVQNDMQGSGQEANLDSNFAILDASDQLRVLKECLDEAEIDLKNSAVKPMQVLSAIGTIKEAKAQGKDPSAEKDEKGQKKPVPKSLQYAQQVYDSYRTRLLSSNALDFDDLIFLTREALIMHPNLQERLHQRWSHILVDEFQDTSIVQLDLVKLLTSRSLFVVGDSDQLIYSWRGAHVGSLSDFRSEFGNFAPEGVETVYLKENYRSTSNIVNAAEKVISSSNNAHKESKAEARRAMMPKRGAGPPPRVVACADERAEAKFVVDTVKEMIADSSLGPNSTVAVIYRTNAQSRYLEEACVQKNLPYVIRGGAGGFYKRAEVKDCLCFLRWFYNGNDESAMLRAFRTPSRGLGDKAVAEFKDYCSAVDGFYRESHLGESRPSKLDVLVALSDRGTRSLPEGAPDPTEYISKRALNNFVPFATQMAFIREKAYRLPVDTLLFTVIDEFKLLTHFDSISKSKAEFAERSENVQELRQATKRYSGHGPALVDKVPRDADADLLGDDCPLGNFLDDVALVSDVAAQGEDSSTDDVRLVVNLMTIHASKGAEFDAVFVVGNEEGTLPSRLSIQEGEGSIALEEEKRLCYVAMTRTKTRLILTWRKEVTMFSNWSDDGPKTSTKERSRFLDALVVKKGRKSHEAKSKGPSKTIEADGALRQRKSRSSTGLPSRRRPNSQDQIVRNQAAGQQRRSASGPQQSQTSGPSSIRNGSQSRVARSNASRNNHIQRRQEPEPTHRNPTKSRQTSATGSTRTRNGQNAPPSNNEKHAPRSQAKNEKFDSTIFYPVGSDVIHNNFGKGVVLEPPPPDDTNKLLVRVKFENGRTMEFPAESYDLVPVF